MLMTFPQLKRELMGILIIDFKLINETGLLIRYPLSKAKIGGADTMPMTTRRYYDVIKEEIDVPYIPGSSFKGRMRGLLELAKGLELISLDGKIYQHFVPPPERYLDIFLKFYKEPLDDLFGKNAVHFSELRDVLEKDYARRQGYSSPRELEDQEKEAILKQVTNIFKEYASTRLIVHDIYPSSDYVKKLYAEKSQLGLPITLDDFLEEKMENRLDRITNAADPRTILRVKPLVEFEGSMKIVLFDTDTEEKRLRELLNLLVAGLELLEDTYLGGSGSRGYGKIRFSKFKLRFRSKKYYLGNTNEIVLGEFSTVKDFKSNIDKIASNILGSL